jgi:hypothetical protein
MARTKVAVPYGPRPSGTRARVGLLAVLALLFALTSCGGGGGSVSPAPQSRVTSITVSCDPASVETGKTSQCTAKVVGTGTYSSSVTWSSSAGSINSSGLLTAPSTAASATVTATSTQDSTKSGSAVVTITAASSITSITVSCDPASVQTGQTSQCTAKVVGTGSYSSSVTWSSSAGSINSSGLLTAPSTAGSATVTATSTQDSTKAGSTVVTITAPSTTSNQLSASVNLGPQNDVVDMLFVSVTVCVPGTSTCQTIPDVQVDTGSEGLRIVSSVLSISLPTMSQSGTPLGECITFADNSYLWGPMATADIEMGGEKASSVPVHIVGDANFPGAPSSCNTGGPNDGSVSALGANGLIGLGVFRQDCGSACAAAVSQVPNQYYVCPSSGCTLASVPLTSQAQNPVWMFPQDNNGLLITLPSVPSTGAPTESGSVIFGIGTQSNNALGSAKVYTTDDVGNFTTTYQGQAYSSSFIDSGSNGLYFLTASTLGIPECSDNTGFYCPTAPVNYTATNTGQNGTAGQVTFSIANADSLFATGNSAFNNLGGDNSGAFDWGLPFFFGRTVFIGIEGQSTPGGTGPYWAY